MRLLNVYTLDFKIFFTERDRPPYVITSHRWVEDEITFQQFLAHKSEASVRQTAGFQKIQSFCDFVKGWSTDLDLNWIWIDTCCIDKTSSSELQEAINSMFRWYSDSHVCLAYLNDVESLDATPTDIMKAFEESVWFRRGWTLQELLAPSMVVFLTSEWEVLGHKASTTVQDSLTSSTGSLRPFNGHEIRLPLNHWIARAARIPEDIIADYRKSSSLSIAEKRSWMDHRKTTRVEDSAYCLLGICGIYLPLIYGEREQAFERLEEAIERRNMKTNAQNSNFSTPRSSIATHTTVSDPVEIDSSDGEYSEATVNWPEVKAPVKKRETEYHVVEKPLPLSLEDTFKGTTKKLKVQRKTYDLHTGKTGVEDKILCVPIKRGLRAGSKIKYPGMGDQVEGGFQDLHFISEDKPHPLFVRNNVNDLKHTISITLKEAASGWSRTVSTIDGKQLNVANSGRTASHWTCYYPGQGMPSPNRPTIRGDLIIKVRIESR